MLWDYGYIERPYPTLADFIECFRQMKKQPPDRQ